MDPNSPGEEDLLCQVCAWAECPAPGHFTKHLVHCVASNHLGSPREAGTGHGCYFCNMVTFCKTSLCFFQLVNKLEAGKTVGLVGDSSGISTVH